MGRRRERDAEARWKCYHYWWTVHHGIEFTYLVNYPPWGPMQLLGHCPRDWGVATVSQFVEIFPLVLRMPMKPPARRVGETLRDAANPEGLLELYPLLTEHLVSTAYDGDAPGTRTTSTLLLFGQDGVWKANLRDRQEQRCLWLSSLLFKDLFAVIEDALAHGTGQWRDDRAAGAPEAKRQRNGKSS